jgi:hypothetical protein
VAVELDHALEMLPRLLPSTGLAVNLCRHAMRLHIARTRLQDDPELGQRRLGIAVVQVRLGQDQARRRVVLEPGQALPAQVDGFPRTPDFAIRIGQRGEGQGGRIPHEALLISPDRGRRHGILDDFRPATLGYRVRHAPPL